MDLFDTFFGELLMTFLIAMVPVLELRGAIPAGIAAGLPPAAAAAAAILGNLVPIPFLILLLRRIFGWLRKSSWVGPKIDWLERRAHLKGRIVKKYRTIGLIILVAIPLPGTGAWTGALVADVLDLRLRTALPAIALGVLIAGIITTTVTCGVITCVISRLRRLILLSIQELPHVRWGSERNDPAPHSPGNVQLVEMASGRYSCSRKIRSCRFSGDAQNYPLFEKQS